MNATAADVARKIWKESAPITGTLAETYLEWRGLAPLSPPPQCLRFAAKLKHPNEQYFPALIVQATKPETGDPIGGVQRVFLAWTGKGKAQVSPKEQKMSLGPCKGAVARLADPIDGEPLMIGEGVETVLTAMQATGLPGWATLGTPGLRKLDPPNNVTEVILLAENDGGWNKKALDAAIPTLIERGIRVAVATPPDGVKDFNDLVNGKSGHAPAAGLAMVKAAIEGAQDVREEKAAADAPDASTQWGDAEREIVAKLALGDSAAFLARAKNDPGFPFEPEAIAALNKLAKDRRPDWQRLRARLKTDRKIHLSALEATMRAEAVNGDDGGGDGLPGRPLTFEGIEPWPEPVDGAELLTDIADAIGKYVIMEPCQRDAAALGAVFAHTHDLRDTAPIFFAVSPTKRCGKTRLERVIKRLVPKPLMASSATPAFLARAIEKYRPTVLIDEYDATAAGDQAMAETLRGQLNSSFDRDGAKVGKCVPLPGGGYDEREFSTWAATWIAGIKKIPDTVEDRSVVLRLKRKLSGEKVARFRGKDGRELGPLRRKIARFVVDNEQRLRDIEPGIPEALSAAGDRAPDAWEPLVAIADVAGRAWPQRARNAALALAGVDADVLADSDIDAELLSDIGQILAACDAFAPTAEQLKSDKHIAVEALEALSRDDEQLKSQPRRIVGLGAEQLTNALTTFVESKWPAWDKGKPMRPHQLARILRAYGVISQPLRDGLKVFRGYPRDRLDDAIGRYLSAASPYPPLSKRYNVSGPEKAEESELLGNVTDDACNALKNAGNPSKTAGRNVVTPEMPGNRGSAGNEALDDAVEDRSTDWGQI
jgi:Protein of unknown function (DUF3631)/Toprim domain